VQTLDLGPGVSAYRFAKADGYVYVVWAARESTVSLGFAGNVKTTNAVGTEVVRDASRLSVGATPLFVEISR
jgi:hypothetical protein